MRVYEENNRLVIADGTLTLWLEPWGENSFRVRMTKEAQMDAHDWALTEEVKMRGVCKISSDRKSLHR